MAKLNISRTRELLQKFDFMTLFTEEMGWDRHAQTLDVLVDNQDFQLHAVAEKRGLVAFVCDPLPDGGIPDYPTRRKIETKVAKSVHGHVYIRTGNSTRLLTTNGALGYCRIRWHKIPCAE